MIGQCCAEYEREGGRQPGDRIVRCHLQAGHPGEHEEAGTENTWINEGLMESSRHGDQPSGYTEAVRQILAEGQSVWGVRTSAVSEVAAAATVVVGDLARHARDHHEGRPVNVADAGRELGNLFLSSVRWVAELGLDPVACVEAALECQRAYVAGRDHG